MKSILRKIKIKRKNMLFNKSNNHYIYLKLDILHQSLYIFKIRYTSSKCINFLFESQD